MARKAKNETFISPRGNRKMKRTSQGGGKNCKPKNKYKRRNYKKSRGQG